MPTPPVIEVLWRGDDRESVRRELRAGLLAEPRSISSKYFYDDTGSRLFEAICELPEYYQTRAERALLEAHAGEILDAADPEVLVELGAGAATKTRVLLDLFHRRTGDGRYVPVDVSEGILRRVAHELAAEYPELAVHGIVGDFMSHLDAIPEAGRHLALFLGGTIGNLEPNDQAPAFLRRLRDRLEPGDWLLLGTDLIKDVALLEAAYNDARGVTAQFNRNILVAVNRLLDADFDPGLFDHRAFYAPEHRWIEMRLVSRGAQRVSLGPEGPVIDLEAGEEIRTEISAKFDRPRVEELLGEAGFELRRWLTDDRRLFALSLARRR